MKLYVEYDEPEQLARAIDAVRAWPGGETARFEAYTPYPVPVIERALATRPRLLLLDEVMGGLNPTEVQEMVALIRQLNQEGVSCLVIEHVMAAVMSVSMIPGRTS